MATLREYLAKAFRKQVATAVRCGTVKLRLEALEAREVPTGLPFTEPEPVNLPEPRDAPRQGRGQPRPRRRRVRVHLPREGGR